MPSSPEFYETFHLRMGKGGAGMMELWYALVDLLPFEWAQPGSMYFMKNALLAVLVISPVRHPVHHGGPQPDVLFLRRPGPLRLHRHGHRGHCGFRPPTWAAVIFAVVFALLFNLVRRRSALASDTVIGVFSSTAVALGIFLSTLGGRSFTKFNSLLIGDILSVEPAKIGLLAGILLLVLALWAAVLQQADALRCPPGPGGQPGDSGVLAGDGVFRSHRRGGHPVHDLGGPAGHQLSAGAARRPEPGPEHEAVPSVFSAGGGAGRRGRPDDFPIIWVPPLERLSLSIWRCGLRCRFAPEKGIK